MLKLGRLAIGSTALAGLVACGSTTVASGPSTSGSSGATTGAVTATGVTSAGTTSAASTGTSAASTGATGSPTATTGATTSTTGVGVTCNDLALPALVPETQVPDVVPTAAGGEIVSGTYHLTSLIHYLGMSNCTFVPTPIVGYAWILAVSAASPTSGTIEQAVGGAGLGGATRQDSAYAYSLNGMTFTSATTCYQGAPPSSPMPSSSTLYTATPTELRIYETNGTCGRIVFVLTKQP